MKYGVELKRNYTVYIHNYKEIIHINFEKDEKLVEVFA